MKKEKIKFLLVGLFFIFVLSAVKADVPTKLEIDSSGNRPPVLLFPIPNQTWPANTNLTNAFDLDDYFSDLEELYYTSSQIENITIIIDSATNIVSFYPDLGFIGIRTVIFTAHDIFSSTDSNIVTLNVTEDKEPPTWSNPAKDKSSIYQNALVTFTTDWADNFALSQYIFSINQGASWVNSSAVSFSGKQNTSTQLIQISAAPGSSVEWRFFAYDTSGNMNATDIQTFNVAAQEEITPPAPTLPPPSSKKKAEKKPSIKEIFEENPSFSIFPEGPIKIEMKQGTLTTISFKITNTGNINLPFEINIDSLKEFNPLISQKNFTLSPGKSVAIVIEFKADKYQRPDFYFGGAEFITSIGSKRIPIMIVVAPLESKLSLEVVIPQKFKRVYPGTEIKANMTINLLGDFVQKNVTLYSALIDYQGNIYNSLTEEVELNKPSISLEKKFPLSKEILPGEYLIIGRVLSDSDMALDTDTFEILEKFNLKGFIKTNFILTSIIFLVAVLLIFMMRYQKTKQRERILNLYLLITQLNSLMRKNKINEAIDLYIRIKSFYGENVASTTLQNKEQLKQEIETLIKKLNIQKADESTEKKTEGSAENKEEKLPAKITHKKILEHLKNAHSQEPPVIELKKSLNTPKKEEKNEQK